MPPVLHAEYTPAQAVAAFGPATAVWFCEGQFALLPSAVLCFITIGSGWQPSAVGTPSSVTWYPPDDGDNTLGKFESFRRSDEEDERIDRYLWFPKSVRETWSAEQKKQVREHHIFLRAALDTTFVYAGPAHLGSLGDGRGGRAAGFSLEAKLPRDAWLRLGGHAGWSVEVDHREHRLNAGDLKRFDSLLELLQGKKFSHLSMTRYEEDTFRLHLNAKRGWLLYLRTPSDSGLTARDLTCTGDGEREEFFECACGIELETTLEKTLPREQAIAIIREFFQQASLPDSVPWTSEWRD